MILESSPNRNNVSVRHFDSLLLNFLFPIFLPKVFLLQNLWFHNNRKSRREFSLRFFYGEK